MENPKAIIPPASPQPWGKLGWVSQHPLRAVAISLAVLLPICLLIPRFTRAWRAAGILQSANNIMQIGSAIQFYATEHRGQYPDSLGTLLITEDLTADALVSPGSHDTPARGATPQAMLDELARPGHLSYHYIGRGLTAAAAGADAVILYEDPAIWPNGGEILFSDGHPEFVSLDVLKQIAAIAASGVSPVKAPPFQPAPLY